MSDKVKNEIEELAESVLASTDFFLTGIEIKGTNPQEVWVYADGDERGINMDECAEISNELSFLMDAHELINNRYRLNVSSPGLSRPLVDRRQYAKNQGREIKVKYKNTEGYHKMSGILQDVSDDKIVVAQSDDQVAELSFDQVVETKVVPSL